MHASHTDGYRFTCSANRRVPVASTNTILLTAAITLALVFSDAAHAKIFIVSSTADSGPGTLRQVALDANATTGPHGIAFFLPPNSTIGLTSGDIEFNGPDVVVQGPGRDQLTISGTQHSRIFNVKAGTLAVSGLTLRDGLAQGDDSNQIDQRGGAILVGTPAYPLPPPPPLVAGLVLSDVAIFNSNAFSPTDGGGGAVFMQDGALTIDHCLMDGNFARRNGGAIMTRRGTVQITDSQFTNNTVDFSSDENSAEGGGILINRSSGSLKRSIVRGNRLTNVDGLATSGNGTGQGAGFATFLQFESFQIEDSEFSDNQSPDIPISVGGGVDCHQEPDGSDPSPTLTLVNSTISGNTSDYGAGLEAGCSMALLNTTIANNTSTNYFDDGGRPGIESYSPNTTEQTQLTIVSSLISGNLGGGADVGIYHYAGYADPAFLGSNALVQSVEAGVTLQPDTIIGVDPLLMPLAYNGGMMRTHALQAGSPAIDTGDNPHGLKFDQRRAPYARVVGSFTDIGAYEFDPDRLFANGFE